MATSGMAKGPLAALAIAKLFHPFAECARLPAVGTHNVYKVHLQNAARHSQNPSVTPPGPAAVPPGRADVTIPQGQGLSLSEVAAALERGHILNSHLDNVTDAWGQFLMRFRMDWFCTMTFRHPTHPEAADKLWRVWVSKLNRSLYGVRWSKKDHSQVFWIRALEWQRRNVIHYHALVGDANNLNHSAKRMRWVDAWYDLAGIARIDPISSLPEQQLQAVTGYVSKYVSKGGEIELSRSLRWYLQRDIEQVVIP